jgi:hypothetical protein
VTRCPQLTDLSVSQLRGAVHTFGVHYRPIPDGNLVTTDHRGLSALMLFIRIHVRSRFTQDYRPGAFSAVPFGTDP